MHSVGGVCGAGCGGLSDLLPAHAHVARTHAAGAQPPLPAAQPICNPSCRAAFCPAGPAYCWPAHVGPLSHSPLIPAPLPPRWPAVSGPGPHPPPDEQPPHRAQPHLPLPLQVRSTLSGGLCWWLLAGWLKDWGAGPCAAVDEGFSGQATDPHSSPFTPPHVLLQDGGGVERALCRGLCLRPPQGGAGPAGAAGGRRQQPAALRCGACCLSAVCSCTSAHYVGKDCQLVLSSPPNEAHPNAHLLPPARRPAGQRWPPPLCAGCGGGGPRRLLAAQAPAHRGGGVPRQRRVGWGHLPRGVRPQRPGPLTPAGRVPRHHEPLQVSRAGGWLLWLGWLAGALAWLRRSSQLVQALLCRGCWEGGLALLPSSSAASLRCLGSPLCPLHTPAAPSG